MYQFADLDPREARWAKLQAWRDAGIDPYPAHLPEREEIAVVRENGNHLFGTEGRVEGVAVSGRLTALREQGALYFADLRDGSGHIQLLFRQDILPTEWFERIALLDLGDFIWASGPLFVTKRGELTVEVKEWMPLSKALRPLPDLWKGLQDTEQRQRQRYTELIVSDQARERFLRRSRFTAALRSFLVKEGFMEVETPVLEEIPGGADAEPFVTHHNALDTDFYLRISLELHLKRLIVGGYDKLYEIGRVFRNEGLSPQHLQEFTMLEFYWAYASYEEMMSLVERMYVSVIEESFGTLDITRGEQILHFQPTWPRTPYAELMRQYVGIDILSISDADLADTVRKFRDDVDPALGRGRLMDQLYKKAVRPHLIQPQFITEVPLEFSPLAKKKHTDPRVTERFMVLIDGAEVGNAFSELNDPIDQRARFEEQEKLRLAGDPEAQRLDRDFLRALEYGMPPTAGFGVGIDRLFAILSDLDSIRETVFFPTMRPEPWEE